MAVLQLIECDIERDRKECIKLFANITGANRELAQWLLDHPRYSAPQVAEWLACGRSRIQELRQWAQGGFRGFSHRSGENNRSGDRADTATAARGRGNSTLKSQDNSEAEHETDDDPGVAPPEEILKNILDTIDRHRAVARAYKRILKVASLDQAMKDDISDATGALITLWQSLQRALRS